MYRIVKDGAELALIEAPSYVRQAGNGCFVLCQEAEAAGIAYNGTVYHLLGREVLEGAESVILEVADAGVEIQAARESAAQNAKLSGQLSAAARLYVQAATDVPDETALEMPDLFKTWEEALKAGKELPKDTIINDGGQLYRVVQAVTPQKHQPPHGEGMLAIYRPIDPAPGTREEPKTFSLGMDVKEGLYYTSAGKLYLAKADLPACTYAPGTAGVWQWEEVADTE